MISETVYQRFRKKRRCKLTFCKYQIGLIDWAEFITPPDTVGYDISEAVFTDKQTIRKKLNIGLSHKNTHINTIWMKENKQLNIQQKQKYPGSVTFYNTQPGNEMVFYNGEHRTGHIGRLTSHNFCGIILLTAKVWPRSFVSYWPIVWLCICSQFTKHVCTLYVCLSYSRRVTVVIRFLRKRWYTVSGVITSSRAYTRRISPLSAVLYGVYKPCPVRTHLIGWRSTVLCSLWPTSCWLRHQSTVT